RPRRPAHRARDGAPRRVLSPSLARPPGDARGPCEGPALRARSQDQQVADLAAERVADRGQGREADGPRAVVLEHREVHDRDADELGQPAERHAALLEELVEPAMDPADLLLGRHQTSPSVSRWTRSPTRIAPATAPSAIATSRSPRGNDATNTAPGSASAPPRAARAASP